MKKTLIVVGAGKGLGNHVAEKFWKNDFRVVLMARNEGSLRAYEKEFADKGVEALGIPMDAADPESIRRAFAAARERWGTPDVLVYNVGITAPDDPKTLDSAELERHFRVDVAGAYACIQQIVDEEFGKRNGTIILTGGYAAVDPFPGYLCLALDKAALRNLALALNRELKDRGVFVGTVMVCGAIQPGTHFAPELIAETFWKMYTERKDWELRYE